MLAKASNDGVKTTSVRVGQICGAKDTGAWGVTEWVPILVKSSISLGALPDLPGVSHRSHVTPMRLEIDSLPCL